MSNAITNVANRDVNDISNLFAEGEIIIDLTQLVTDGNSNTTLGYYFADERERIIAGKVITTPSNRSKLKNWLTISAAEIPAEAVTLSFFVD